MTYEEIMGITPGSIVPGGFSITPNATYIGPGEPILDAEGNAAPGGHYISKWDPILVLDIGYTRQLTLIQYPAGNNEIRQGYIINSLSKIEYSDLENNFWQNGSTSETVYLSYSGNSVLGSLDPQERAIFLYKVEDRYNVVYSTGKGPYTKSGFVNYSGGISAQITEGRYLTGGGSSINNIPAGGIVPGGRTYPANAVIKFDSLYIRDENGNIISGRETSIGDEITVIDISYSKQLALIQYPSGGNIRQGYVTNNTKIINYINPYQWVNGSSTETVYLDSQCTKKFGTIDPYESATLLYKKDGVYCVAYDAPGKNGGMDMLNKCGFVRFAGNKPQATPSANELLYQGFANNVEKISYGTSPAGYPLNIYKIGNGNNVLFANFAIHGFEDDWNHDGTALVHIANELIRKISATSNLFGWTVYINNCANPDGTFNGISKDGPGRCTVSTRIDMNRCFPYNFSPMYNTRNYTGGTALGAPEAQALHDIVLKINREKINGSNEMVVIDFHGWMGMTQGNPTIGQYFNNKFGYGSTINQYSAGFFSAWAQASLKNTRGLLVEYPKNTRSIAECDNDDYVGKTYRGIIDLLSSNKGSSNTSNSSGNLSIGDKGQAVKDLQAKLAYIGYPITIDGIFGNQTLKIVKQFQSNNGLYVDGIVGKQTMNKLDELVKREEEIKNDNNGKDEGNKPTKDEEENKYISILKSLGFNSSKVIKEGSDVKVIEIKKPQVAIGIVASIEEAVEKPAEENFPSLQVVDGKVEGVSLNVSDSLEAAIGPQGLQELALSLGDGLINIAITDELHLTITIKGTLPISEIEYSTSLVLDLYLLNGVKPSDGSMPNSSYTTWSDLLNTTESQMKKFSTTQVAVALGITALVTGASILAILNPPTGISILIGGVLTKTIESFA